MLSSKKSLRIILADDDEDDRMLFKEVIEDLNENIEVVMFENGDDLISAVRHPAAAVPDFIFLDINMPRKNGHECLKEIRKLDNLTHVPVVIYSTSTSRDQVDKTYNAGANLYIKKPTSFKALKEIAENVFTLNWDKYLPRPKKENFIWSSK
jgi:CheY-like chemotaxis protein